MSIDDSMVVGGLTLITVGGWYALLRVWRHQTDVAWRQKPGTPQSAGYNAAFGVVVLFATVVTLDVWGLVIQDSSQAPETVRRMLWWVLVAGFCLWPLAGALYLFLWPRFLVAPHLRESPTVASTHWRRFRAVGRRDNSHPEKHS